MTTNSQLLTTKPKKQKQKQKQTKPTTRTGTEPQKWGSQGGLSTEEWEVCLLYTSPRPRDS